MSGLTESELRQQIGELLDVRDALSQKLRAAQHEAEALAATVEALRKAIIEYDDCDTASQSKKACGDMIALAKATPQQHLLDVRAEAFKDGGSAQKAFWEGFERGAINGAANIRSHWNEYVERVRSGGKP